MNFLNLASSSFLMISLFMSSPGLRADDIKLDSRSGVTRPTFEMRKLFVGHKKISVEVADSEERRAHGLMFVEKLPKDQGMFFIFEEESIRSFWMKNTLIPLSIAFIDKDMMITEILDMVPAPLGITRPKSYTSKKKSRYALELNTGWFVKNKIWPGARVRFADNALEKAKP
jgi:uncharacterized membrane protein (UPF0127 family)